MTGAGSTELEKTRSLPSGSSLPSVSGRHMTQQAVLNQGTALPRLAPSYLSSRVL